ncbi:lipid-binding protein [uncultured Bacteroides sp.]|uniref:lipid-binding protein n=1 Tax=uncultured Bacteroides sp. TaxID=162156 RepID=UPI00261207DF|nr:lipid-binding protein [uncultured Bacteroides sp.]
MKKYIYLVIALLGICGFTACDPETNEEPGGTAVEKMAGTWTVTFQQSVDEYYAIFEGAADPQLTSKTPEELDKLEWDDVYGMGKLTLMTYNTASNTSDAMWFDDANFWGAKVKCDVNYGARTFSCKDQEAYEGCSVNIIGGKVLEGAATTPRGMKADSIVAYVYYSDDSYGFTYMKMSGYRYTGFNEDK